MPAAWFPFVAVPLLCVALLTVAWFPRAGTVAPLRLAVARAAVAVGAFAVGTVEAAGAVGALTAPTLAATWTALAAAAVALAVRRRRADGGSPVRLRRRLRVTWAAAGRTGRLLFAGLGGLLLVTLGVALLAEPNNFDSQTYHLPKVERWAAQSDLAFWPTAIHRQVTIPPGAEYLLLHLRLFTGGDALHNLVQWVAGVGCLLLVSRIAGQLGGGRRAQLLTAFLLGTTPMVVLQATSTQTDLVAAAWAACAATFALDGLRHRAAAGGVLALGAATGLTAITKTSGLLGVGPMLVLWGLAQLRLALRAPRPWPPVGRLAAASVTVLAVGALLVGPFLVRVHADFGHPLGPPRLRESIPMQRHDPAAVLVNGARIGHTALDTPLAPLRSVTADAIGATARTLGVDPQDRAITFGRTTFPVPAWYPDEDRVSFPIAGTLALIGVLVGLARPRWSAARRADTAAVRAYAAAAGAAVALYPLMIKWQPWGNRLLLYALVLTVPLAGLWLDAVLRRGAERRRAGGRPVARTAVAVVLAASALAGVLAVSYGFPRRLVGAGSVFTTDSWDTRFLRRPQWADEFRWGAAQVERAGASRVGLVQQNDNWEYPWWLLLGDREIVALQSVLPERPPAAPDSVDVILCTGEPRDCERLLPAGWSVTWNGYVAFAAPPR